jgi:molybdopterin-guanine dinucleotide biosynthesis protein A
MKISAVVLAGGKSRRMGRRKALETIGGKSLIERAIDRIGPISSEVLIVTSRELLDFPDACEARVLVDLHRGKGPMAGIYRGLLASRSAYSLVVACDMPFLSTALLRHMTELADGFDAVVPRLSDDTMEPLHAIYSKSCLSEMKRRLDCDRLGVDAFIKTVRVRYVERAECERFDPQLRSFLNLNYESDLEYAVSLEAETGHREGRILESVHA